MKTFDSLINTYAKLFKLEPHIVKGVVWKESSFDPGAYRYERGFYRRYIKDNNDFKNHVLYPFPRTISASYGLCQIMYTTALEMGYNELGDPLRTFFELYDPVINIRLGCKYLATIKKRFANRSYPFYSNDTEKMLSAYNAGSPTDRNKENYVNKILDRSFMYLGDF